MAPRAHDALLPNFSTHRSASPTAEGSIPRRCSQPWRASRALSCARCTSITACIPSRERGARTVKHLHAAWACRSRSFACRCAHTGRVLERRRAMRAMRHSPRAQSGRDSADGASGGRSARDRVPAAVARRGSRGTRGDAAVGALCRRLACASAPRALARRTCRMGECAPSCWIEDVTNADERLDRNYLRRQVLPRSVHAGLRVRAPSPGARAMRRKPTHARRARPRRCQ